MQAIVNKAQDAMGPAPTATTPTYKHREGGQTMRALAWFGKEDVRMVDAPIPDITEPTDVVVKVTGTTICGSDLHLYHSEMLGMQKGDILGHEFMGFIDRVGDKVSTLKVGDKVVVSFQTACGTCKYCKKKWSSMCDRTNNSSMMASMYGQRDAGFFGYGHLTGGFPGGQSEYVRVPFGEVNCLKVPPGLSGTSTCPTCFRPHTTPSPTHASTRAMSSVSGDCATDFQQCVVRWALLKGAKKVYAIDTVPMRLELAKKAGNVEVIDFNKQDVLKTLETAVPDGLDVAIDCTTFHEPKTVLHKVEKALMLETDHSETLNETIHAVRKFGRVGLIGVYAGYTNHFNVGALMEKGVRFIGNGQAPVHLYWHEILNDYIKTGKFDPSFMVSHRVPIEDFPELYRKFDNRYAGVVKVFVETPASEPPAVDKGYPQRSRVADWAEKAF
ncbi:hypothetical protein Q5752_004843 [Cryptotrichosporon argae]